MRYVYIKDGVKTYARPKVAAYDGHNYLQPTDEQLEAAGWTIETIIDPIPEPYIPTLRELVEQYMRENGYPTDGSEVAVICNYLEQPTDPQRKAEFEQHAASRAEAKKWAEEQPHREEEEA